MSEHHRAHINFHPRGQDWAESQTLHVAVAYTNPHRFHTRRKLMENFRRQMSVQPNIRLHVGEVAYGNLPFEVTDADHPYDYQFRTNHVLWLKENIHNQVVAKFPKGWENGAYVDADCLFTRYDWALEAIQKLAHHPWVQLFSSYSNLGPQHQTMGETFSAVKQFLTEGKPLQEAYIKGATGLGWAFTREGFNAVGGFMDRAILGAADWHMTVGLLGIRDVSYEATAEIGTNGAYSHYVRTWQERAKAAIRGNVGMVDNYAVHYHHGPMKNRAYDTRWKILRDEKYDPYVDVFPNSEGILQLTPDKPGLRTKLTQHFASRDEDDTRLVA